MQGLLSENRKIGMALLAVGVLFLCLGVLLLFDRALLAMGNILFLSGFPFLIGFWRTVLFFNPVVRRDRWRAIVCFLGGVSMVLLGWPLVGMLVEAVGIVSLFGPVLPMVVTVMRSLPVIGTLLSLPVIATIADKISGRRAPV